MYQLFQLAPIGASFIIKLNKKLKVVMVMRNLMVKLSKAVACLALSVTTMNVNTTCICLIHQPKLPKGAEKLRKF
jgi:AgrD protein